MIFKFDSKDYLNPLLENIVIFHTYPNDLYLSWVLEFSSEINQLNKGANLKVFDLATKSWHRDLSIFAFVKRIIIRTNKNSEKILSYFSNHLNFKFNPIKNSRINFRFMIKVLVTLLKCKNANDWLCQSFLPLALLRSVHSSISNYLGTIYYSPRKYAFRMLIRAISYQNAYQQAKYTLSQNSTNLVVVCNGRLPNSAGAAQAAKDLKLKTVFLERGGTPGMLNVFDDSPHSFESRYRSCLELWDDNENESELREIIAKTYIELRGNFDPIAGKSWTDKMNVKFDLGLLPKGTNKLCTFYTSTELEFAVYKDSENDIDFKNQREAFDALRKLLPKNWCIVIRRHPTGNKKARKDPEKDLWLNVNKNENTVVIDADSPIDSYDLAQKSDLVAHFNSSIGPEIIYMQKVPVLTLGPTYWESSGFDRTVNFENLLHKLKSEPVIPNIDKALRWGFYSAVSGKPFKIISWKNGRAFYENRPLFGRQIKKVLKKNEN